MAAACTVVPCAACSMTRMVSSGSHISRQVSRNVPLLPRPSSTEPHGTPSARSRCSSTERARPFGARTSSSSVRAVASGFSRTLRCWAARSRANGTCGASSGTSPMASPTISSRWIRVMPPCRPSPFRRRRAPRRDPGAAGCAARRERWRHGLRRSDRRETPTCRGRAAAEQRRRTSGRYPGSPGWLNTCAYQPGLRTPAP